MRNLLGPAMLATALLFAHSATAGTMSYVDISSLDNNNIFTDLNQNFPNTGPGVPGSHTGTANSTYLFTPGSYTPPAGTSTGSPDYTVTSYTVVNDGPSNGVSFLLKSNSLGQDFVQIGTSGPAGYTGPNPVTATVGVNDVTDVYVLMSAYVGQSYSVTFTGADGSAETFQNIFVPDFNGGTGGSIAACIASLSPGTDCMQTAYVVHDVGGGSTGNSMNGNTSNYDLTDFEFALDGTLSSEELASMLFTSNGYETLLFGITAESPSSTSVPEPFTLSLFGAGVAGAAALRRRKARQRKTSGTTTRLAFGL